MPSEDDLKARIFKQPYEKREDREDGLILKIHHTVPGDKGGIRRTRFIHATFNCHNELLATADHRGNIFVIDLANSLFWRLGKQQPITLLSFHPHLSTDLFVGTKESCLFLLNAENGQQLGSLSGHSEAAKHVSFSSDGNFCLSVASCEGYIWDLKTLTQAHRLNLQPGMKIKIACFMPASDNILACFEDDAIHIWAFQSFQCIKQIVPDSWSGHSIESVAFTRNGRALVLGGTSRELVIFTVDDWNTQRVLRLPEDVTNVLHVEFLPQSFDSGANQVLAVLTGSGTLLFLNLITGIVWKSNSEESLCSFTCSWSGKYVVCNTVNGEAKIFSGSQFLANSMSSRDSKTTRPTEETPPLKSDILFESPYQPEVIKKKHPSMKKHTSKLNHQVGKILDVNRLRRILKTFLEYPEQYRSLIWHSILQLPRNKEPWSSLSERPLHPAAQALSKTYPIQNKIMFDCLQSVLSCLAHWSPVFGEIPYLANFIFPFIKLFHSDKFVCFEVAATLITNWCQHWFEYLSFPPVNILGMIENVLSEHDSELIKLFYDCGITSHQYAWPLLSTAFSEVLTPAEWRQLWDHILSNPPWFLLCAVVAYNISCRVSLKTCSTKENFEFFFRNQNPVNMKHFIKKCYEVMEKTSSEYHPSQYLTTFTPLPKGNYPVFSEYPRFIVNYQKEQRDAIQREEEIILREQHKILSRRLASEEMRLRERKARIQETRLLEAEKAANASLHAEEARLIDKRRQLAALRRELRAQEEEAIAATRVEAMELQVKQRSAELDRLHHQLHTRAKQSGLDRGSLNEEVHEQFSQLNVRKHELQERLRDQRLRELARPAVGNRVPDNELLHLKQQQQLLSDEICKLRMESNNRGQKAVDFDVKIAELDSVQQRVEVALARKAFLQQDLVMTAEHCREEAHAVSKLAALEKEVNELSEKLCSVINSGAPHVRCKKDDTERLVLNPKEPVGSFETTPTDGDFQLRSSEFYRKEKCAVTSAMELRKCLLSGWSTN